MKFYCLFLLISVFCFGFFNNSYSQSKGGRWQFENNGFDTADWDSFDDNGTLQGNAGYSSLPPLQEGIAYLFLDTVDVYDYFKIEDSNDLDFTDEDIALSAWIYPLIVNDVHFLINKGRQDSNPKTTNYAMRISLTGNLEFLIRDANNQAQTVASSFTIPENQWTFVAIFYDYSLGKVYMWNDPTSDPADTLDFTQSFFANNDPLSIGSWYRNDSVTPSTKDFEGRMDDIRISGRPEDVFPGPTEISAHLQKIESREIAGLEIYPNPMSLSSSNVNLKMYLPMNSSATVSISIYNILGQKIYHWNKVNPEGIQHIKWNMHDNLGNIVNTGIYFVKIDGLKSGIVKKLMILK
jgi:hypothetical protein